ncbi:hypothetical protein, partial [Acinetobacter baumannii]|uniref:hypothetical protein n=1 Tax=Acinetobacter baumannii TaxID=470 RepID=UPI003D6C44D6
EAISLEPTRASTQAALARLVATADPPAVPPRLRRRTTAPASLAATPTPAGPAAVRFDDVAGRAGLVFRYDPGATEEMF